jgi:hypothetical protein
MPLPFVNIYNRSNGALIEKKPIAYSGQLGKSVRMRTSPRHNINTLIPTGISYVRKSITDNAIRALAIRQYNKNSIVIPYMRNNTT